MSRVWVFGDKTNTGTDSVESFQLADTGTYEIKLTIINPCGSAEAVDTVVVTEP